MSVDNTGVSQYVRPHDIHTTKYNRYSLLLFASAIHISAVVIANRSYHMTRTRYRYSSRVASQSINQLYNPNPILEYGHGIIDLFTKRKSGHAKHAKNPQPDEPATKHGARDATSQLKSQQEHGHNCELSLQWPKSIQLPQEAE